MEIAANMQRKRKRAVAALAWIAAAFGIGYWLLVFGWTNPVASPPNEAGGALPRYGIARSSPYEVKVTAGSVVLEGGGTLESVAAEFDSLKAATLTVNGAATVANAFSVAGDLTVGQQSLLQGGNDATGAAGLAEGTAIAGTLAVSGTVSKGSSAFEIDHPLDPEWKVLRHASMESPDMKTFYDGVALLDARGDAIVELPNYFEALNRDYRYQLMPLGMPAPGLYIKEKIRNNRFTIAGGAPGGKVSWQVTGIRQDTYAREHPLVVEERKPTPGYLYPELYTE